MKYAIEIVDPNGQLVADLSGLAQNIKLIKSRNEADELSFTMNLPAFEKYCKSLFLPPASVLYIDRNEVRLKRNGVYLSGCQINFTNISIDSNQMMLEVRASGFLSLFKYRYTDIERSFSGVEATTVAWTLIDETQSKTNGDFGITQGTMATVGNITRQYSRAEIKTALQDLTNTPLKSFDMEFTYDKVFNTYASIGSVREDIVFEYPNNIIGLTVQNDGTQIGNSILAIGAGFGQLSETFVQDADANSQINYFLREKKILFNASSNEDGSVDDAAEIARLTYSNPITIVGITVDSTRSPYITDFGIGDSLRVRVKGIDMLDYLDGLYPVEKYELTVDNNENETTRIYFT